ncbi:hypothetical protein EVAR_91500_1 [Eumeta japonica]|uniref:Uncharacterized protein n=1 Tax=Eumeta variegata TaxID=151549 RepID=A0A4C1VBF1_EUMVA|nr:hypothetical protein EVAR_91500_1 [Eumeta japonica]
MHTSENCNRRRRRRRRKRLTSALLSRVPVRAGAGRVTYYTRRLRLRTPTSRAEAVAGRSRAHTQRPECPARGGGACLLRDSRQHPRRRRAAVPDP